MLHKQDNSVTVDILIFEKVLHQHLFYVPCSFSCEVELCAPDVLSS